MAADFIILADSGSDLSPEMAAKLQVQIMPLMYALNDGIPVPGNTADIQDFYNQLRAGKIAKTSAANYEDLTKTLEAIVSEEKDVLYIAFSSGLSSTAGTATLVCEELTEKYPNRKIYVVDSLAASLGYGLLVYMAAHQRSAGADIDAVRDFVEENKLHLCHWFTVDDLHHLKRGGRVSAATAAIGTMLSIKPVLHVDDAGHLINVSKARGRKASLAALVEQMEKTAIEPAAQTVFISHGDAPEDAELVAQMVRDKMGVQDIHIGYIGPVIGAHSGPGTVALFFLGSKR